VVSRIRPKQHPATRLGSQRPGSKAGLMVGCFRSPAVGVATEAEAGRGRQSTAGRLGWETLVEHQQQRPAQLRLSVLRADDKRAGMWSDRGAALRGVWRVRLAPVLDAAGRFAQN